MIILSENLNDIILQLLDISSKVWVQVWATTLTPILTLPLPAGAEAEGTQVPVLCASWRGDAPVASRNRYSVPQTRPYPQQHSSPF